MKKILFLFLFSLVVTLQAHAKLIQHPYEPLCVNFMDQCSFIKNFTGTEPKEQCKKPWHKNEKFLEVCRYEFYTIGQDVILSDADLQDKTIRPVDIYYYNEKGKIKINTRIPSYVMERLSPEEIKELVAFYQREAHCAENVKSYGEDITACSYLENTLKTSLLVCKSDINIYKQMLKEDHLCQSDGDYYHICKWIDGIIVEPVSDSNEFNMIFSGADRNSMQVKAETSGNNLTLSTDRGKFDIKINKESVQYTYHYRTGSPHVSYHSEGSCYSYNIDEIPENIDFSSYSHD